MGGFVGMLEFECCIKTIETLPMSPMIHLAFTSLLTGFQVCTSIGFVYVCAEIGSIIMGGFCWDA